MLGFALVMGHILCFHCMCIYDICMLFINKYYLKININVVTYHTKCLLPENSFIILYCALILP